MNIPTHMKLGHLKHGELLATVGEAIAHDGNRIAQLFTQLGAAVAGTDAPTTVNVHEIVISMESIEFNLATLKKHIRESQ